eukprot:12633096-Alexandrium_andersonii.AAC.1
MCIRDSALAAPKTLGAGRPPARGGRSRVAGLDGHEAGVASCMGRTHVPKHFGGWPKRAR